MATESNNNTQNGVKQKTDYLPFLAGWLVPGAGHFLLRQWVRGSLIAVSILGMFGFGLAMQGKVYTGFSDILDSLNLTGDLGNGIFYLIARVLGLGGDQVMVTTADYGTRFIGVAGLLNIIAAVDAYRMRNGRKPL